VSRNFRQYSWTAWSVSNPIASHVVSHLTPLSHLGHYHAYATGNVFHRDLSENNLMFKRDAHSNSEKGVVNDWDVASHLDDKGEVPTSTARHRTGTIPFMACDLLVDEPPVHIYRHDLESFFYNPDLGRCAF
jgi:hypothetical protein